MFLLFYFIYLTILLFCMHKTSFMHLLSCRYSIYFPQVITVSLLLSIEGSMIAMKVVSPPRTAEGNYRGVGYFSNRNWLIEQNQFNEGLVFPNKLAREPNCLFPLLFRGWLQKCNPEWRVIEPVLNEILWPGLETVT